MKTGNIIRVDTPSQVHNLSLVSRILEHNFFFSEKCYMRMDVGEISFV